MAYLSGEKNFAKDAQKSPPDCGESIRKQILLSCRKKSNDFFLCLHCLVSWKLQNLETWVNFRIAFKMLGKSNQKNSARRETTWERKLVPRTFFLAWGQGGNEVVRNEFRPKVSRNVGNGSCKR